MVVNLPPIYLKPKKETFVGGVKSGSADALDFISSIFLEPKTLVTKGVRPAIQKVSRRRREISQTGDVGKALDVVGETIATTTYLGGAVLGAGSPALAGQFIKSVAPKTARGVFATLTGVGFLSASQTGRDYATKVLQDPTKAGRELGLFVDKTARQGIGSFDTQDLKELGKTAGLLGLGAGAVVGGTKVYNYFKDRPPKTKQTTSQLPTATYTGNPYVSSGTAGSVQSVGSSPVIAEETQPQPELKPQQPIKITNKPEINIAIAL